MTCIVLHQKTKGNERADELARKDLTMGEKQEALTVDVPLCELQKRLVPGWSGTDVLYQDNYGQYMTGREPIHC